MEQQLQKIKAALDRLQDLTSNQKRLTAKRKEQMRADVDEALQEVNAMIAAMHKLDELFADAGEKLL